MALEQYGAGPFATMHLADLGAEVIKIEDPGSGGDVARYLPPFQSDDSSLFFESYNRNKRSVTLDIRNPAGRAVFEDLVATSDAVFSNLRGDLPEQLAICYDDLKGLNPRIVCCSLSGFGMTGPRASQPGYDYILQGLCGWMALTGDPDGPPTKSGLSMVDFSGGFVAAISLLTGIHAARRDGAGMDCDLSLYDTAISLLGYVGTWHLTGGFEPQREAESGHPSLVPFQVFETRDGWLVVACAILRDAFATRTASEWLELLEAAGVPAGPIQDVPAALRDPHTLARGVIAETDHPHHGKVRQPITPVRVGEHPAAGELSAGPALGADAGYVLKELLGYDDGRIDRFRADGAFG